MQTFGGDEEGGVANDFEAQRALIGCLCNVSTHAPVWFVQDKARKRTVIRV